MKTLLILITAIVLTTLAPGADMGVARAQKDVGLVLESHVGARPRDADYLLAPLLDQLKKSGFRGSSVAGTRIHSQHSISSKELNNKQVALARQTVKDAHLAYVDGRFEGAIDTANRVINMLLSRPATMAKQQDVRDFLYDALIIVSMAHSRLGQKADLEASMTEFIRSFPKRDVSNKKYGPEGKELYRKINRRLQSLQKGELQIAAAPGSMIFINESYRGIGTVTVQLVPGRYRIYTQNGAQSGRVHIADVEAERKHTLVVDPLMDSALRTSGKMVGFVFEDEALRDKHEKKVALQLGRALGAEKIVLVGFHKFNGRDSIVASSIVVDEGESGPSARVPLPPNGAPSASQLRALADFVTGSKPASNEIEVMSSDSSTPIETNPPAVAALSAQAPDSESVTLKKSNTSSSHGPSPAWRWSSWVVGAAGVGAGAYLISIHDTGTCDEDVCPENYDTIAPGIGLVAGGTAVGLLGFYLWSQEGDDEKATRVSVRPTAGGFSAALSGRF